MIIIGVTGLIAAGKSSVSRFFEELAVPVFDADRVVGELYESAEVVSFVREVAPEVVRDEKVDRYAFGKKVFADAGLLKRLEEFLHPRVRKQMYGFIDRNKESGAQVVVLDIPLLFEGGLNELCDYVIYVKTSEEELRNRYLKREDADIEKFNHIIAKQKNDEKEKLSDYVVDTSVLEEETKQRIQEIYNEIISKNA